MTTLATSEAARGTALGHSSALASLSLACLVKSLFGLPTWTFVAALIAEHPGLQEVLGGSPSVWACYRFTVKLRAQFPLLDTALTHVLAGLHSELPKYGRDVAIDASDLPAYANGQRYVSKGGKERERFSDPDASWGHRSSISTRKGGGFYGFKLHLAVCTQTGLPLAWRVETARRQESLYVAPLLDAVRARGFKPKTCAMDKGCENARVYAECEARGTSQPSDARASAKGGGPGSEQPGPPFIS